MKYYKFCKMTSKQSEYNDYINQIGEKIRNKPSRKELEKMKQENAANESGFASVLNESKNRDFIHKVSQKKQNSRATIK